MNMDTHDESYVMTRSDDVTEQTRLDLQHQIWLLTLNGSLTVSTITKPPSSILDIGTGTGAWAVAMAQTWPNATVVATDLTPPTLSDSQSLAFPNLKFQKSNADERWNLEPAQFDLIHGRMLASGIHDWPGLLEKCFKHLSPGGSIEFLDLCHPFRAAVEQFDDPEVSPFIQFGHLAEKAWAMSGLDYRATTKHVQRLTSLGYVEINEKTARWPLGEWADTPQEREIGKLTLQNFLRFIDMAGETLLINQNAMSPADAQELALKAKEDLVNHCLRKKFYLMIKFHTAKKPSSVTMEI